MRFSPPRLAALIALLAAAAAAAPAAAQEDVGVARVTRAIKAQEQLNADLRTAAPQLEREAAAENDRLGREEAGAGGGEVSIAALRQARFEADTGRTRLAATESRIRYFQDEIAKLDQQVAAAEQAARADPGSLETYAVGVRLDLLRRLRASTQETADLLRQGTDLLRRRVGLLADRAALLQARIRLGALDEAAEVAADPRGRALRDFVERTGRESVRLANEASLLEPQSPADGLRRRQIELQADQTFLRSGLRAADIDLLGIEKQLAYLTGVAAERDALPARLATEGLALLAGLQGRLAARTADLADLRRRLTDQRALLPAATPGQADQVAAMRALIADVAGTVEGQEQAVKRLAEGVARTDEDFRRREAAAEGEALLARTDLPVGAEAWRRVGRSALRLPEQLARAFADAGRETAARVAGARPERLAAAAGAALLLLLAALLARRLLHRRVVLPRPGSALAAPAAAVRDSVLTLVPAAAWWAVARLLEVSRAATLLIVGALAIWPVVAFVLLLARRLLFRAAAEGLEVRESFYRRLRWTVILGGVLAGLVTLTSTLPLTPALADLVNRSSMVCVLLIALPGLQLRALILTLAGGRWRASLATRLAAQLSLAVPLVLAGAAAVGLAGYLNLAWSVIRHFLWAVLLGGLLLLALGVLADSARALRRRITERDPDTGYFWTVNFVEPAYRLAQLLATLAAGWALLRVYGWTAETPVIRELLAVGRTPVVSLGASALSLQDIVLAVVLVGLAFWVGGWSQQVSYNLALTRVRDPGIRQSLSTFVQYVVIVLGLLLTLKVIGLDLTALTVFAASVGVGIGFGLQNVVNNFISGVLLLVERPLRVTDTVTIGGETGEVSRIGIRSLVVRTPDRKELIIPNSAVIGNTFTNWTRTDDVLREVLLFKISYRDDPRAAAELIEEVARTARGVLPAPAPKATLYEFTDAGVTVRLQYHCRLRGPVGGLDIRADILTRVREALARAGLSIATPGGDILLPAAAGDARGPLPALAAPEPAA